MTFRTGIALILAMVPSFAFAETQPKPKRSSLYALESQSECQVQVLARSSAPGRAGDVFHFPDLLGRTVAKGRVLSRTESSKPGRDRLEISLARLKDKPCPVLKEVKPVLGDAVVRGSPELPDLPSAFEAFVQGGYILENWKVSEKTSGSGIAAGLLMSYEMSRTGPLGILFHAATSYEMLQLENQSAGLPSVDPETSVSRLMVGAGAGLAYHLGDNGHSRFQLGALYEMSLMGQVSFKIDGASSERDHAVLMRIRPGLRFDQMITESFGLGIGLGYSTLSVSVPDTDGKKVDISADALHAEIGLGISF